MDIDQPIFLPVHAEFALEIVADSLKSGVWDAPEKRLAAAELIVNARHSCQYNRERIEAKVAPRLVDVKSNDTHQNPPLSGLDQ